MKLSSSTAGSVGGADAFAGIFASPAASAFATADAHLEYYLRIESAIATAGAASSVVATSSAEAVVAACLAGVVSPLDLQQSLAEHATPIVGLVDKLRDAVPAEAREALHIGATSQDIVDTANMLAARDVAECIAADSLAVAQGLVIMAREFRSTPMIGRTLGQHALAITCGAWAALRLRAIGDAAAHLVDEVASCAVVQLGGPVGTSGALTGAVARQLGLAVPPTSWHSSRGGVARIASAAAIVAGELGALAADVITLTSSDIAEFGVAHPGGSSAMPHERNPASAVNAAACAHRVPGAAATVLAMMPQSLQRDPGRLLAEWGAFGEVMQLTAATAHHARLALEQVEVHASVMSAAVELHSARTGRDCAADIAAAEAIVDRVIGAAP